MIQVAIFKPVANIIVIRPDPVEEITESEGGILLPDASKPTVVPRIGTVISMGPDARRATLAGERVYFSAYAGTSVEVNGEELLWMTDDNIIAGV